MSPRHPCYTLFFINSSVKIHFLPNFTDFSAKNLFSMFPLSNPFPSLFCLKSYSRFSFFHTVKPSKKRFSFVSLSPNKNRTELYSMIFPLRSLHSSVNKNKAFLPYFLTIFFNQLYNFFFRNSLVKNLIRSPSSITNFFSSLNAIPPVSPATNSLTCIFSFCTESTSTSPISSFS